MNNPQRKIFRLIQLGPYSLGRLIEPRTFAMVKNIIRKLPLKKNGLVLEGLRYIRYLFTRYLIKKKFCVIEGCVEEPIAVYDLTVSFFGYYNISPVNNKGDLLFLKVNNEKTHGSLIEPVNIMLKERNGRIKQIADSRSWNWQQGCMLQWLLGHEDMVIYNDYDVENKKYVSKVIDASGKLQTIYDIAINNVSKTGKYALGLNYERLALMRPDYGYFNVRRKDLPNDEEDGIWYLDLTTGYTKLIISLEQLKIISKTDTMNGVAHKVNHIDINPAGTRFMFLHRWIGPQGRFMRLITANPDGTDLHILNGDLMTSHCCWIDNENILSYCFVEGKGAGYFKFKDKSNTVSLFSDKLPKIDGHPSFSPNKRWLVIDTYPDSTRMSFLYLYDVTKDVIHELCKFHQPFRYRGQKRIDLHPKWSPSGAEIIFESGHNGKRGLYTMSICKNLPL